MMWTIPDFARESSVPSIETILTVTRRLLASMALLRQISGPAYRPSAICSTRTTRLNRKVEDNDHEWTRAQPER